MVVGHFKFWIVLVRPITFVVVTVKVLAVIRDRHCSGRSSPTARHCLFLFLFFPGRTTRRTTRRTTLTTTPAAATTNDRRASSVVVVIFVIIVFLGGRLRTWLSKWVFARIPTPVVVIPTPVVVIPTTVVVVPRIKIIVVVVVRIGKT